MAETSAGAQYPSLRNRVIVVTGGASGIGEFIVRSFAAEGAKVIFLDIKAEAAHALIADMNNQINPEPSFFHCDLSNNESRQAVMAQICSQYPVIDALINNAGNDTRHTIETVTSELCDQLMAVNLKQQFFVTQSVIPLMRKARRGSIINMSSIAWLIPSTGLPVYVTAKAAIIGLTRTLCSRTGRRQHSRQLCATWCGSDRAPTSTLVYR